MTLLKPENLSSVARGMRAAVEPEVKAAMGGDDDWWGRFERILGTLDRMLEKYYAMQDAAAKGGQEHHGHQQPATMEDLEPRQAEPGAQPTGDGRTAAAGAIFDSLSGYIGKVPMANHMTVDQLSVFMQGNRDELVAEIAKGLESVV